MVLQMKTIRSSGPRQTSSITAGLRAAGQAYKVVPRNGSPYGWNPPSQGRNLNPGRGSPGNASPTQMRSSGAPVVTYTAGPGGFTQTYAPPVTSGVPSLGGFPAHNPGYSHPVFDPVTGEPNFFTEDFLAPDGRVLREPSQMSRELPEIFGALEHANLNPGYWNDQFTTFARNNPGVTGVAGVVAGAGAIGVASRYAQAAGAVRQALRRSPPVGFNTRPRGGAGTRFSALPSSPFEFMR